jgi:hypothetical protein
MRQADHKWSITKYLKGKDFAYINIPPLQQHEELKEINEKSARHIVTQTWPKVYSYQT